MLIMNRERLQALILVAETQNSSGCDPILVTQYINLAASLPIVNLTKETLTKRETLSESEKTKLRRIAEEVVKSSSREVFDKISKRTHKELSTILHATQVSKYGTEKEKRLFLLESNPLAIAMAAWDPVKVHGVLQDVSIKDLRDIVKTMRKAVGGHKWFARLESRKAIIDSVVLMVVQLKSELAEQLKDLQRVCDSIRTVTSEREHMQSAAFHSMLEEKYMKVMQVGGGDFFVEGISKVKQCVYMVILAATTLAALHVHWLFWVATVVWWLFGSVMAAYHGIRLIHEERERERERWNRRQSAFQEKLRTHEDDFRHMLGLTPRYNATDVGRAFRERSLAAHPDRGGSHEEMVALNEARDGLMSLLDHKESWWQRLRRSVGRQSEKAKAISER